MNSAIERLVRLRARDIMSRNVVQVGIHQSMPEAASILHKHQISAAPVIDEKGHCVGVLTATDFVRRAADTSSRHQRYGEHLLTHEGTGPLAINSADRDMVGNSMSPALQTVSEDTTMLELSRIMCTEHLHHVVVLDDKGSAVAVISSLDIASAVVNAINE